MSMSQRQADKIQTARECREIKRLYGHLQRHATDTGFRDASNNDALLMLAPAADLNKWQEQYDEANHAAYETDDPHWHTKAGGKNYADDQLEEFHPLLIGPYWEDRIRNQLGTPTERRATVPDSLNFIVSALDWAYDEDLYGNSNFAGAKKMLEELRGCRTRLENILKDGIRHEKTETPCPEDGCTKLLVKIYRDSAAHDYYQCPSHRDHIDYPRFVAITHQHLWSAASDHVWVSIPDAAKSTGRSKKTIMSWITPSKDTVVPFKGARVEYRRVGPMRRIEVKWDDVRTADADAKRRTRTKDIA